MNAKSATLNVRVTIEMREAVRAAAAKDGESEGVLVRKALRLYFDRRDTTFLTKSAVAAGKARAGAQTAEITGPAPASPGTAQTDQLNDR